jgi:hypothetical protein
VPSYSHRRSNTRNGGTLARAGPGQWTGSCNGAFECAAEINENLDMLLARLNRGDKEALAAIMFAVPGFILALRH